MSREIVNWNLKVSKLCDEIQDCLNELENRFKDGDISQHQFQETASSAAAVIERAGLEKATGDAVSYAVLRDCLHKLQMGTKQLARKL